jgi:hypothetical protein
MISTSRRDRVMALLIPVQGRRRLRHSAERHSPPP